MKQKLSLAIVALVLAGAGLLGDPVSAASVEQSTVLGGVVSEVVPVGTTVKEGDALLSVETIGGPMVAARATVHGVVESVTVAKGATVQVGQSIGTINDGK